MGCPYTNLKNKMEGYINYILRPKREEFGNVPVCPFAGPELDQDKLMIDVFDPSKETFIDKMIEFKSSKYNSALFAQVNTDIIPESDTRKYQSYLNKLIKTNGFTNYKIICFNPEDTITNIDGFNPRQFAPAFLINVADKKELGKAHRTIMKSKYFDRMSDAYKKYLNV
jgi:hypothetical protein|tara:strand:+ start:800 stop:1306 length:507 start_codon:yes stop_codon:yes gene_type:complete